METGLGVASLRPDVLTPSDIAACLPSRPVLSNPVGGWDGTLLQRFRHPPGPIETPGQTHNLVVCHLTGPVLIENHRGGGLFEKRWTECGHISVTPAGKPTRRVARGRPDVVLVHLAPGLLDEVIQEVDVRRPAEVTIVPRFGTPDGIADRIIRLMLAEAEAPGPATTLMAGMLTRALAVQLMRAHSNVVSRPPEQPPSIVPARLRRVVELMHSCMDEELTLEQLAATTGLSLSHFARAFRNATGQSPHRYLVGLRIERAQELLETSELPVTEIGLRCGFGGSSHFATAFRKATEHSPRAWRELHRA